MKKSALSLSLVALLLPAISKAANSSILFNKDWTFTHTAIASSEISAFDSTTNSIWVAGVTGVDILDLATGTKTGFIDTSSFGSINSVAIKNGVAAFAIENAVRTNNGIVQFYNTGTRALTNTVTVGALPDMLTFTPDGSKVLVANEATPTVVFNAAGNVTSSTYGARTNAGTFPATFGSPSLDPAGSVSIINTSNFSVTTAGFTGVTTTGNNIRTSAGMDYEPEYIAVNAAGTKAYVTLQEANAMGVLDIASGSFEKIVGLGAKDYSLPGNQIDPKDNDSSISFISPTGVKGLYMPDGVATYESGGNTYLVMANEGDFREDDADRSAAGASGLGTATPLDRLRVLNDISSTGNLFTAGTRSFSIRDADGNIVFDSGDQLDKMAAELGIYDNGRSRDKGVEPEGVALLDFNGKKYAFIGLERTLKAAVAVYDITDPANASFLDMIVTDGDRAPEGIQIFESNGKNYLAISNESADNLPKTTTLYSLNAITAVPEPETYAMLVLGLAMIGFSASRKRNA